MMDVITNFFNYSPNRQKCLESHVMNLSDEPAKSKLLPLCRTRWVERLDALEVVLDLAQAVTDAFSEMVENVNKQWNRDTVTQASALLKRFDFEFIINLVVTQKVLAYTSSITTRLQTRGFDIVKAYDEIHLVITTLEKMRNKVDEFHHDCFAYAKELAIKIDVDIKKPRTCQRQRFRLNAVGTASSSQEEAAEEYFRINTTIPFLDQVVSSMKARFEDGQALVVKGTLLIPACVITEPDWKSQIQPCVDMYSDDLPYI